ncbi:MAG: type IV pilus modification protein PilV [Pseudomonadales bacterium]
MNAKQVQGFSLVELLFSVLIMAIGILGVAALQVVSLQQNRNALYRAEAVQLANDLMDRIRVNTQINYTALLAADPQVTTDCTLNPCSRTEMAAYDVSQWKCAINMTDADGDIFEACANYNYGTGANNNRSALPGGRASVGQVSGVYVITVEWVDNSEGDTSSIALRAQVN